MTGTSTHNDSIIGGVNLEIVKREVEDKISWGVNWDYAVGRHERATPEKRDVIVTIRCDSCRITEEIAYFHLPRIEEAIDVAGQDHGECHTCDKGQFDVIAGRYDTVTDIVDIHGGMR